MAPRKILTLKLRSLGDTVLMTAPLAELRRAYPDAKIHALVSAAWAPVLENHPAVDRIWTHQRNRNAPSRLRAIARLAIGFRHEHFDWVVGFHASPSSALLAFASGAKKRSIHFHGHKDRNLLSTVTVPGKGTVKPIIERDMDTVRALGINSPEGIVPKVHLRPAEEHWAQAWIAKTRLEGPILGIGLGASRPTKSWPIDRFADLAVLWTKSTGGSVIAFSGRDEEALKRGFLNSVDDARVAQAPEADARSKLRNRIICESELSVRELAALQSRLAVFTGNDSGPRHLALAVGTPTVTIFGPEDPFEWHPYPQDLHPRLFVEGLPCRTDALPGRPPWCGIQECREERHRCMTSIGVREVLDQSLRVARTMENPS